MNDANNQLDELLGGEDADSPIRFAEQERPRTEADQCGADVTDHEWARRIVANRLIEVRCSACGITPMDWLYSQPIVNDMAYDSDMGLWSYLADAKGNR